MSDESDVKPPVDVPITSAPVVHTDALWDRDKLPLPGMLENFGPDPIPAPETQAEYFELLNKHGLRMKHQQESSTGPEREPDAPKPHVRESSPPLTEGLCRVMNAMSMVLWRYQLAEALWCSICFEENDPSGCRYTCRRDLRMTTIECRCGRRSYTCTTDLSYTRSSALVATDHGNDGMIVDQHGNATTGITTVAIQPDDARIILRHFAALRELRLSDDLYCARCEQKCEKTVSDDAIAFACKCHLRHWSSVRH